MKGKVTEWNDSRGYGFITTLDGEHRVFIHASSVINENQRPSLNDKVSFETREDNRGRLNAVDVTIHGFSSLSLPIVFGCSFVVFVCAATYLFNRSLSIALLYVVASVVTYTMFALDKNAAQNGRWRTSEGSLLIVSLLCGWPGALIAQQQLRHKTKKQPFKTLLWLIICINIGVFIWTFSPSGIELTQTAFNRVLELFPER